jgi:hypothetical protein
VGLIRVAGRLLDDGGPADPADLDKPLIAQQGDDPMSRASRNAVPLGELLVRGQLSTDRQLPRSDLRAQLGSDPGVHDVTIAGMTGGWIHRGVGPCG